MIPYKPSAAYYRHALRTLRTKHDVLALALQLVCELERHKEFIREQGLIPPKWFIMQSERDEKHWGEVIAVDFATATQPLRRDQSAGDAMTSESRDAL